MIQNFQRIKYQETPEHHLLEAFTNSPNPLSDTRYYYFIAGVHGDEPEGVFVLEKWMQEIKSKADFLPIIHVPIVNIDGYKKNTRVNARKVDLNRNLPTTDWSPDFTEEKYNPGAAPLSEVENQFLEELFRQYPPRLCVSFHSWKPMINYNGNCKEYADFLSQWCHYPSVPSVGYETPGSLGNYLPEKYQAGVLTYELPVLADYPQTDRSQALETIWKENQVALQKFYSLLLDSK